ncbi:FAST kinase domain-containing protein 4-like isoform X1 [Aphidius gifuensis]|uniref:FAST kinase domain-containing protein 4-like isoform X1 n=1 Tax=Aphidius gifuensis TaxID=684658 RepID=UPI001CDBC3D1|nr:FAST kinase domain-containing protein 4-like isoform X1 [Aphidius gifuensis]
MLKLVGTLRNGSRYSPVSSNWCLSNHQAIGALSTTTSLQKIVLQEYAESKNSMTNRVFKSLKDDQKSESDDVINTTETILKDKKNEKQKITKAKKIIPSANIMSFGVGDLNESFADVKGISLVESVKLMSSLATRQRRVKPLLKTLADNINNTKSELGIKNIADILYSMAKLNFRNELLLKKLSIDLQKAIESVDQSPIVGSILTSLGMLKYRNDQLMDELCKWCIKNKKIIRTQDLCAMVLTLATIGYVPVDSDILFTEVLGNLKETDMTKSSEWLDVVWSLTILNRVTSEKISSVLDENFHIKLADPTNIPLAKKHKLLNINAYAKSLLDNYKGPLIQSNSPVFDAPLVRTKDKQVFVKSITDALANLFPSRDHFRLNVDGGTGFLTDIEFYLDKKGTPLIIDNINNDTTVLRIAILANYYHDYCLGKNSLLGSVLLHQRLLEANGYKIINISHSDLHTDDKLLTRITYISNRLKTIVK